MSDATLWKSIATPMVPQWNALIHSKRARMLLNDAAVWQGETERGVMEWRFPDGSKLRADACRCWAVVR